VKLKYLNIYISTILFLTLIIIAGCKKDPVPGENEFMDERDKRIYKTVTIGWQTWMAENLAYLPSVDTVSVESDFLPLYYIFEYDEPKLSISRQTTNFYLYGVLYNWTAAAGACPRGWHLPTDEEWKALERFAGMDHDVAQEIGYRKSGDVGFKLKTAASWFESFHGGDEFGFNIHPGGRKIARDVKFSEPGEEAFFWTSSSDAQNISYLRYVTGDEPGIYRSIGSRKNGLSVRCVKDQ